MTNHRDKFLLPKEVTYLNNAYMGPLLKSAHAAAHTMLETLANPSLPQRS